MRIVNFNNITIEIRQGDIVKQPDCDCIVNAANAQLRIGGGVAGAIHRTAGETLTRETRPLAPIKTGEAVITGGHNLPNEKIIHCLGPVYGRDEPSDEYLEACYRNALHVASENQINSIAFPAISTGAFGFPLREAADISLKTIKRTITENNLQHISLIRFVLWSDKALTVHEKAVDRVFG